MDKVIDNLWIGSLAAARDPDLLHNNGITSILSVMRGRFAIHKSFTRHQVLLDDTTVSDAIVHFPVCIEWIDSELKKGRGVLVHCQVCRSATIVAAYLMYTRNLDVQAALDLICKARPSVHPNDNFMAQLAIFHSANYKRTRRNKETRAFYVDRAVKEVLNGDGSALEMDMFAKYPRTPSESTPNTPYPQPRRRLRCKMCRQELATREHMVDHGQVGPATPAASHGLSPAVSRRPSAGEHSLLSRRNSSSSDHASGTRRMPQSAASRRSSFGKGLAGMTPIIAAEITPAPAAETVSECERRPSASETALPRRSSASSSVFDGLCMTPMTATLSGTSEVQPPRRSIRIESRRKSLLGIRDGDVDQHVKATDALSMSAIESDEEDGGESHGHGAMANDIMAGSSTTETSAGLSSPQELAARIHPNLAALRTSPLISALSSSGSLGMTPLKDGTVGKQRAMSINSASPPLLMPNANCSGYFVEPMKWMEPFLEAGSLAGKITCPNKKCGAKLGNYDWAGVGCSCKEWVVPGFCIHKSKVDEVVI
ncbi:hypothetical protein JB92DRAFT_2751557 [Gautieria morchelliformis]|nr:hypothetical protein JB92DRAFT_2751557 [Gautieria morchelliformis]